MQHNGYRYDTETGLYYLNSRYYNPEWGRFVNADGIVGNAGDLLGHNMFVYCRNNSINMSDPSGYFPVILVAGGIALLCLAVLVVADSARYNTTGTTTSTSWSIPSLSNPYNMDDSIDQVLSKTKTKVVPLDETNRKKGTPIYRYATPEENTYKKLTPDPEDFNGLSFSLKPPKFGGAFVTTMEEVNLTGKLIAINDHGKHVSIKPLDGDMSSWINTWDKANETPHPYTRLLKDELCKYVP